MKNPRILMNPGPRLEELCALYLYRQKTGQAPEVQFRDTHGDLDPNLPDIDVRVPYPRGSSAFEQMALALKCTAECADLIRVFNQDNQTGFLNRHPHRESFVWLIPRLFDLAPADEADKIHYRQFLISQVQDLADLAFWAFAHPELRQLWRGWLEGQPVRLRHWPQRQNFVKNWPLLAHSFPSPFSLAGYAYLRFVREENVPTVNLGLMQWQERFASVQSETERARARLCASQPEIYRLGNIWAAYLKVQHQFDTRAFFDSYRNIQVVVSYDARGRVPQAAIQVRHGADFKAMMERLFQALEKREPDCWHLDQRVIPGPSGTLINGGRNRFREQCSQLAADPQQIFALMNECA